MLDMKTVSAKQYDGSIEMDVSKSTHMYFHINLRRKQGDVTSLTCVVFVCVSICRNELFKLSTEFYLVFLFESWLARETSSWSAILGM